jgi:hypothetical protein
MGNTWGRVLLGIAVAACLLGLGALEVLSQRVRVDTAATTAVRSEGVRPEPSGDALALHHDDLLGLEADTAVTSEAPALGVARTRTGLIVLEIDEKDRRLSSLTARGRVLMTEVSNEAVVVTEGRRVADLAALKPGDVIRIEPANGQIQRIVVLRPAWREMTSPGQ